MVLRADSTLPLCVNEQTCNLCSFANMWHSDTTARAQFVLRIRKRGGYRLCASMASNWPGLLLLPDVMCALCRTWDGWPVPTNIHCSVKSCPAYEGNIWGGGMGAMLEQTHICICWITRSPHFQILWVFSVECAGGTPAVEQVPKKLWSARRHRRLNFGLSRNVGGTRKPGMLTGNQVLEFWEHG